MESSVHREVQALFGGGTVETCHGDMVRRHFPTLQKSNHQRISLPDPVAWSGSSVYMEK